jgi:hypothetical protein
MFNKGFEDLATELQDKVVGNLLRVTVVPISDSGLETDCLDRDF